MWRKRSTLTACPKKPFPMTSPWMRSEGLKMRCVRSPESTRRDSERTMSLFWDNSDSAPGDSGHLSMLLLRLIKNTRLAVWKMKTTRSEKANPKASAHKMCLVRSPTVPWFSCCWLGTVLILILSPVSSSGLSSSSKLGSLWVELSFSGAQGSGPPAGLTEAFAWGSSSGFWGLCSIVSCRGLAVSWITEFIYRARYTIQFKPWASTLHLIYFSWYIYMCQHLVWRYVADWDTIDLQYSVPTVNWGKQVRTKGSWVKPEKA